MKKVATHKGIDIFDEQNKSDYPIIVKVLPTRSKISNAICAFKNIKDAKKAINKHLKNENTCNSPTRHNN